MAHRMPLACVFETKAEMARDPAIKINSHDTEHEKHENFTVSKGRVVITAKPHSQRALTLSQNRSRPITDYVAKKWMDYTETLNDFAMDSTFIIVETCLFF